MSKKVVGILVGLVVVGGAVGWKYYNRGQADSEAKAAIHSWIEQADGYAENKPYFDSLLDQAHEAAFKSTYEIGSRRRSAKFDAKEYAQQVFSAMKSKAESDGRAPIAQAIDAIWNEYRNAAPSDSK